MKITLMLASVLLLASCGKRVEPHYVLVENQCDISTVSGGTLLTCNNSSKFIPNGATGPQGPIGLQGPAGPAGVSVVQLCTGTTTYPSVFVELAFVIAGRLYAVYSANNGFLFELVPGSYSSNAVGSSCNFTVNPDLTVSN